MSKKMQVKRKTKNINLALNVLEQWIKGSCIMGQLCSSEGMVSDTNSRICSMAVLMVLASSTMMNLPSNT